MSVEKAKRLLLERFAAATGALFVAIFLDLPQRWALADAIDPHGRSVLLVGRAFVDQSAEGHLAVEWVLSQLQQGLCPDLMIPLALAPRASEAFVQIVEEGPVDDFLIHGPRWAGKTILLFAAVLGLAEFHLRAQYDAPFRVMLLHDSLKSADAKSAQSLELPMWSGVWTIESDRTRAVCRLGGREVIRMDFIGCVDTVSSERLRQSTNCVGGEEYIGSLNDGSGVTEDQHTLARSSMLRLETRRRVSLALTNPGGQTSWPYRYWGLGSVPLLNRCAIQIPREDRLTLEQQAQLDESFATNPILQRRLSRGEWIGVVHGAAVAENFDPAVHVAPSVLHPDPRMLLACGIDGGFTPSVVVGQLDNGQVRIFAGLTLSRGGMLELLEQQLIPWLQTHAPWARDHGGAQLVSILDPNLRTPSQISIWESPEQIIQQRIGGRVVLGPTRWAPRRESILKALAPRHVGGRSPLQISPGEDTALLVQAFSGSWYYAIGSDGQVDRSGPKKPNSPAADLGDAACYLLSWLFSGEPMELAPPREITVESIFSQEQRQHFSGQIHVESFLSPQEVPWSSVK